MKFRTEVEIPIYNDKINYNDKLFFIGSCFALNIGQKCVDRGLNTMINPFGVTYNPLSLVKIINIIEKQNTLDDSMFRKVDDKWCSLMHHSTFDNSSLDELKASISNSIITARQFIKESSHIFLTLGTSWVYEDISTGETVNNCHKIAEKEFRRRKLSVQEIVTLCSKMIDNSELLKNKKIILTVSPIRHIKDTLQGNSLSKATLLTAIGELCQKYPAQLFYFPSYEIMIDDLRDYRFYESDMIHPSSVAIDYIFEVFEKSLFATSTIDYGTKMEKITRAMSHRVIDENSEAHKRFKLSTLNTLLKIKEKYPLMDYEEKLLFFK